VHLIDESCAKIFADCGDPAAQPDVFSARGLASEGDRIGDSIPDEVKRGPSTHRQGGARVMGQHEDWSVIWRIVAPPSLPSVIRPRASHRPEHVATDDPRSNVLEPSCHEVIINTGCPGILIHHGVDGVKGARFESPFVQCKSTDPKRIQKVLTSTSAVPV
jgi:hypothetical protein